MILGKCDESLAQGSSRKNWQEAMDLKELWRYNLLGLTTKCGEERSGNHRGLAVLARIAGKVVRSLAEMGVTKGDQVWRKTMNTC